MKTHKISQPDITRDSQSLPVPAHSYTPAGYRLLRKQLGTQVKVAAMLGVTPTTIVNRESSRGRITREMMLAMEHLRFLLEESVFLTN